MSNILILLMFINYYYNVVLLMRGRELLVKRTITVCKGNCLPEMKLIQGKDRRKKSEGTLFKLNPQDKIKEILKKQYLVSYMHPHGPSNQTPSTG